MSTPAQHARNYLGGLIRQGAPAEAIAEAERCLKYAKTSAVIRAAVESAPPFTAEQKLKLTAILTSPAAGNGAA